MAGELERQGHQALGELSRGLGGDARVAQGEAPDLLPLHQVERSFGACLGEERQVAVARELVRVSGKDDGLRGAAVHALVDGADPTGGDDLQQPDIDQQVDVVGHRPTRSADSLGQLGHAHRSFEDQIEQQRAQRIAERLQFRRSVGDDGVCQLVVE